MGSVSIIITSYNKEKYIKEAIDSALNQTIKPFEILVIDDGSTDNSSLILKEYESDPLINLVFKQNEGIVATRNMAIQMAKGDYILQLDADDLLNEKYLEWTVSVLDENPEVGIAYCQTEFFGLKHGLWDLGDFTMEKQLAENQIVVTALFRKSLFSEKVRYRKEFSEGLWDLGDFTMEKQLAENQIVVTALFRKSLFSEKVRYRKEFSEGLEDWDFWLSVLETGVSVRKIQKIGFYYRILDFSRNNSYDEELQKKLRRNIFLGHKQLYLDNGFDSTNLLWENMAKEAHLRDMYLIYNGLEYRLGKFILAPFRAIQKIMK